MYKITFPSTKGCILSSESSSIPEDPNIQGCSEHNFEEERMLKPGSCMLNTLLHIKSPGPINGKVIPHSTTEVTVEKQVSPILIGIFMANNIEIVI